MRRPLLLDLFCCEGGAAVGYHRAGFDVIGVDIAPQPNYPFPMVVADAIVLLHGRPSLIFPEFRGLRHRRGLHLSEFDAFHASPPCQRYSDLAKRNGNADDWPDLVDDTRLALQRRTEHNGRPYVIENVEGAPLRDPITLCGTMFDETRVIRHRLFESNMPLVTPEHPTHPLVFTHDKRKAHYGKLDQNVDYVQVTGGGNATVANKRDAMGMPWASGYGCNEAVPPAYTEFIGAQLMQHVMAPTGE